jgi:DNA (cytosine-5)-methyltransferase 1
MKPLVYGSVCSGIEAATQAWHGLGWTPAFFSEIDAFPRAVLKFHHQEVPLHGDFTTIQSGAYAPIDLLVGGTPCQAFSLAGLRRGLADDRGNLALEFVLLADRLRPRWLVWENVPGVLSSRPGDDPEEDDDDPGSVLGHNGGPELDDERAPPGTCFQAFLSALVRWEVPIPEGGWKNSGIITAAPVDGAYGVAWRVLDAQHFGIPQRRRRVFVVGYLGDWRRAAAVLFEPHCLSGNSPPRRRAGEGFAAPTAPSLTSSGRGVSRAGETRGQDPVVAEVVATIDANFGRLQGASGQDANHGHSHLVAFGGNNQAGPIDVATAVNAHGGPHGRLDFESETFLAEDRVTHALTGEGFDASEDGTGRGTPLVPIGFNWRQDPQAVAIGFSAKDYGGDAQEDLAPTLRSMGHDESHANGGGQVAIAYTIHGTREGTQAVATETDVAGTIREGTGSSIQNSSNTLALDPMPFDTTQITHPENRSNPHPGDPSPTLAKGGHAPAIAFAVRGREDGAVPEVHEDGDSIGALRAANGGSSRDMLADFSTEFIPQSSRVYSEDGQAPALQATGDKMGNRAPQLMTQAAVRRLTPTECERLQGFPDGFTAIPWRGKPASECPDGPRYKALGNSMAVPVMAWIGEQIAAVEEIIQGGLADT